MNHQTSNRMNARSSARPLRAALGLLPLSLFAVAGCASDELSIGSGEAPLDALEEGTRCGNGVLSGSAETTTQSEIDALAGCEEVTGDLTLLAFPGMDLTPLSELRIVRGNLTVGGDAEIGTDVRVASLGGLEAVQQVNELWLRNIDTPDLSEFRNLTRVNWDSLGPHSTGGRITIMACERLRDLTGLENLTDWNALNLYVNDELRSLEGLRAPRQLRELDAQDNPLLRDLSALVAVEAIDSLILIRTGVESFDGFQLAATDNLYIRENPDLVDLNGLNRLKKITELSVVGNGRLDHLPEWPELTEIARIEIIRNAELRAVPAYRGGTGTGWILGGTLVSIGSFGADLFHVGDNPKLTSIGLPGYDIWRNVAIWNNASLTELDLSSLTTADGMIIRDNAVLSTLEVPSLFRVDDLQVVDNPLLSILGFADVDSYTSELSGNLDDAAP